MIAAALSLALIAAAPPTVDVQAQARQFLEAFAADPVKARQFVTKDAMIVMGDIGDSYEEYVKVIEFKARDWLKMCQIGQLTEKPSPTTEELKDGSPRYHGGKISVFEGTYSCARQTNPNVGFAIVLKGDRVVDLYFGQRR